MRRPRHAAEDGSFGRSAGMAAGRGAILLAVAVVLGIILLNAADDPPPDRVAAGVTEEEDDSSAEPEDPTTPTTPLTAPPRAPQEIRVLPTNGTAVKGVAGKARDQLQASGYNVLAPTDAQRATSSNVYFTSQDFEREAQAVAAALGLPASVVVAFPSAPPLPVSDGKGANVIVVVGPELAEQLSSSGTATTSTTAATSTTTRP